MFTVSVDVSDALAGLERMGIKWGGERIATLLYTSCDAVVKAAVLRMIKAKKLVSTGQLFQRTIAAVKSTGPWHATVHVGPIGVTYAEAVEKGQAPHTPNREKMVRWARLKLGIKQPKAAEAVAAKVMKRIAEVGAKPHPFLKPAFDESLPMFLIDFVRRARLHLGPPGGRI